MPRRSLKADDLATIEARREALRSELAELDERAKVVELAARDAGRHVLISALDRIKISAMGKDDAKGIASAIAHHGGKAVAAHLSTLS